MTCRENAESETLFKTKKMLKKIMLRKDQYQPNRFEIMKGRPQKIITSAGKTYRSVLFNIKIFAEVVVKMNR